MFPRSIRVVACINTSFINLNNIPLHAQSTSINGHLGCFRLLTIMSNAAMNVGVQVSSFGYVPRMELLGPMIILFLIFFKELPCFPSWLHHFTFSTNGVQCVQISTSSPTLDIFWVWYSSLHSGCEVSFYFSLMPLYTTYIFNNEHTVHLG